MPCGFGMEVVAGTSPSEPALLLACYGAFFKVKELVWEHESLYLKYF